MVGLAAWSKGIGLAIALAGGPQPSTSAATAGADDVVVDASLFPSEREVIARDLTIVFAITTLAGIAATVVGAVIRAGAPSAGDCDLTGIEGPNGGGECSRRMVSGITLAAGIPVAAIGGIGTTVMARRWHRFRTMRMQLSATSLTVRF